MAIYLVTGATGFLGKKICMDLVSEGHHVYGVGRNRKELIFLDCIGVNTIHADLSQPENINRIRSVLGTDHPDAIIHCAALASAHGTYAEHYAANVLGTRSMILLAGHFPEARFIHISTPSVYAARRDSIGIQESSPLPRPLNDYALTKTLAENEVNACLGDRSIILRPRAIYGAGEKTLIPPLVAAAARGPLPRLRKGQAHTNLTYVSDVVRAVKLALHAPGRALGQTYNIAGDEALKITDIVNSVARLEGMRKPKWTSVPEPLAYAAARISECRARLLPGSAPPRLTRYLVCLFAYSNTLDCNRAYEDLGWQPLVSFKEGLRRTYPQQPHDVGSIHQWENAT
jgi:nucleoside-diphosphate-sugar epimerase